MAHFAQLDQDNTVIQVIVINNTICGEPDVSFPETEIVGQRFIANVLQFPGEWKQTSYSASFRKNYAGIGGKYDEELDAFIPEQPFPSWILNEETCQWESPVPHPADGGYYVWNEAEREWQIDGDAQ